MPQANASSACLDFSPPASKSTINLETKRAINLTEAKALAFLTNKSQTGEWSWMWGGKVCPLARLERQARWSALWLQGRNRNGPSPRTGRLRRREAGGPSACFLLYNSPVQQLAVLSPAPVDGEGRQAAEIPAQQSRPRTSPHRVPGTRGRAFNTETKAPHTEKRGSSFWTAASSWPP